MQASVVIPSNRPTGVIRRCLDALANQTLEASRFEVLVVFNGLAAADTRLDGDWPFSLRVQATPRAHIGAAKNIALSHAFGDIVVLLNDDVVPRGDFLERHLEAHARLERPAMVLGASPWRRPADETVFDRMIAETSMIFFYDRMRSGRWYGFRHAWNLNLSLPRAVAAAERFDESLGSFFFEDLELAYRLEMRRAMRVWYHAAAVAEHAHRYTLAGYLDRERDLGAAALDLWRSNPGCFRAVYGAAPRELASEYERFVERESPHEQDRLAAVRSLARRPVAAFGGNDELLADVVRVAYLAHLPVKRLVFRRSFLERWRNESEDRRSENGAADSRRRAAPAATA